MSKSEMATRSAYRTLKFSFSRPRRVTTYVKPPHLRRSVLSVKQALTGLAALAALQLNPPPVTAADTLPTGANVIGGAPVAVVSQPNATTMRVDQFKPKAIIEYQSFSIGSGNTVQFVQPNASSVALNRVVGNDGSRIFGTLTANGQVFLINPNGVLFAPGASVSVGGIVASTLDISNQDFHSGNYVFQGNAGAGSVINQGTIHAPSGYAALIGPKVANTGLIRARSAALAAGN